uniref:Uncharacterized protein n=1 Tax=Romanomermis culicivorax TaxID=13658 RepID=A0A915ICU1_ROMCU
MLEETKDGEKKRQQIGCVKNNLSYTCEANEDPLLKQLAENYTIGRSFREGVSISSDQLSTLTSYLIVGALLTYINGKKVGGGSNEP